METMQRGIFKKEVGQFDLSDYGLSAIIVKVLIENGFEVTSRPIKDDRGIPIGEQITVNRIG